MRQLTRQVMQCNTPGEGDTRTYTQCTVQVDAGTADVRATAQQYQTRVPTGDPIGLRWLYPSVLRFAQDPILRPCATRPKAAAPHHTATMATRQFNAHKQRHYLWDQSKKAQRSCALQYLDESNGSGRNGQSKLNTRTRTIARHANTAESTITWPR
jgi:hypothetical protein